MWSRVVDPRPALLAKKGWARAVGQGASGVRSERSDMGSVGGKDVPPRPEIGRPPTSFGHRTWAGDRLRRQTRRGGPAGPVGT